MKVLYNLFLSKKNFLDIFCNIQQDYKKENNLEFQLIIKIPNEIDSNIKNFNNNININLNIEYFDLKNQLEKKRVLIGINDFVHQSIKEKIIETKEL